MAGFFSISDFKAQLNSTGIIRSNFFAVMFIAPPKLQSIVTRPIILFCDGVNLPGVSFDNVAGYQRYGYGQSEKISFMPIFQDSTFSFILDNKDYIRSFFDKWVNSIVNFNMKKTLVGSFNGALAYEVNYKTDITTQIQVYLYDENINQIVEYTLRDAYPLTLGNMNLNWGEQNQILRLPVTFSYKDWFTDSIEPSIASGGINSGLTAYDMLATGSSIIDVMSSLPTNIQNLNQSIGNIDTYFT